MSRNVVRVALSIALLAPIAQSVGQDAKRLPSEVLHDVVKGRLENLRAAPNQVEAALKPLLATVRTTDLDASEEVALGLSHFFTFDGPSAKPLFEKHRERDDLLGRVSWQALQQMTFLGAKDFPLGERRTAEFRAKFRPVPDDLEYTARMITNLARRRDADGEHARVATLIVDDVASLPAELPFMSFDNLGRFFESFRKAGRDAEALGLMKKHRDAMRTHAASLAAVPPATDAAPAAASLQFAHRRGVLHLFPFQDWLFEDQASFTRDRSTALAIRRAVDQYTQWIEAAERGQPLTPPR